MGITITPIPVPQTFLHADLTDVSTSQHHVRPLLNCWATCTVPSTLTQSENITSLSEDAAGDFSVTVATDFAATGWAALVSINRAGGDRTIYAGNSPHAVGLLDVRTYGLNTSPVGANFNMSGMGGQ